MADINEAIFTGRLCKDIELKLTQGGVPFTTFTVAVQRRYKGEDGKYETDFLDCVAWHNNAEFLSKFAKKGNSVCIVSEIRKRSYTDKTDVKRDITEFVVKEVSLMTRSSVNTNKPASDYDEGYSDADEDVNY